MSEPEPEPEQEASRRPDTTRDQRRDCQLMRRLGYTQSAISRELGLSLGQVQYALSHAETPITRPGRPSKLSEAQVEELKAFMAASPANERMPFAKIPQALGWDVGEYCIRHALRKLGHKRTAGGGRRNSVKAGAQSGVRKRKRSTTTTTMTTGGEAAEAEAVTVSVPLSPSASALAAVAAAAAASASPVAASADFTAASTDASLAASSAASPTASMATPSATPSAPPEAGPDFGSGPDDEAEAEQGEGNS